MNDKRNNFKEEEEEDKDINNDNNNSSFHFDANLNAFDQLKEENDFLIHKISRLRSELKARDRTVEELKKRLESSDSDENIDLSSQFRSLEETNTRLGDERQLLLNKIQLVSEKRKNLENEINDKQNELNEVRDFRGMGYFYIFTSIIFINWKF